MSSKLIRIGVIFLILIVLLTGCKTTYVPGNGPNPYEHIEQLKEGTAIIFIQSYRNQLKILKDLGESKEISDSKRAKAVSRYSKVFKEREEEMTSIMTSFREDYNFSEIKFSFDYELQTIKNGSQSIIECISTTETQTLELPENVYFIKYSLVSVPFAKPRYDWHFLTKDREAIPAPFPRVKNKRYIYDSFFSFFSKNNRLSLELLGGQFNEKLNKFYGNDLVP